MSVKLYNATSLPDALLRTILTDAQRLSGATGSVVVRVGETTRGAHGLAHNCSRFRAPWTNSRWIATAGGFFEIWVMTEIRPGYDVLSNAQQFFRVAIHEFAHIKDFHFDPFEKKLAWAKPVRRRGWRNTRIDHDRRPEEIRAENTVWEAEQLLGKQRMRRERIEENIIALGIELEKAKSR